MVQMRKENLEKFLNELQKYKAICESKEFCKFLGYQYHYITEVKNILGDDANQKRLSTNKLKNLSNFEITLKPMKNLFKFFMPVKAKYGQLPVQVEDVVVNDQTNSKYSITPIQTPVDVNNEMVLKKKLNKWFANYPESMTNEEPEYSSSSKSINETKTDLVVQKLTSCLILILFHNTISKQNFFIKKMSHFFNYLFVK